MGRKNKRKKSAYYRKLRMDWSMHLTPGNIQRGCNREHKAAARNIPMQNNPARNTPAPRRGEIWFAEFVSHPGTSVQEGCRPALIVSNDMSNQYAETVTVVPMTTRIKKENLPAHVVITPGDVDTAAGQYMKRSMLLGEQVTTIGKRELTRYVGKLHNGKLREAESAVLAQMNLVAGADMDTTTATAETTATAGTTGQTSDFKEGLISYGS